MKLFCVMSVLIMTTMAAPAKAGWFKPKEPEKIYLNTSESPQDANSKLETLKQLQKEMTEKFSLIESELQSGDSSKALGLAKQVLDTVRVKTGIDPKVRMQESFLAPTKFAENAASFNDLNEAQQILVIRTISDFRAGLYMDIMNLSKRTTLLYIKAFQAQLMKSGGLTKEDKTKIVNDLVKASLVPMPVEDKAGKKIFVFDEDVANEDHTYLFNRELKMFLIEDKELEISEDMFDFLKQKLKTDILTSGKGVMVVKDSGWKKCLADTAAISYSSDRNDAQNACFKKYYSKTSSMEECSELARGISYSSERNAAQISCFNKFNK